MYVFLSHRDMLQQVLSRSQLVVCYKAKDLLRTALQFYRRDLSWKQGSAHTHKYRYRRINTDMKSWRENTTVQNKKHNKEESLLLYPSQKTSAIGSLKYVDYNGFQLGQCDVFYKMCYYYNTAY